MKENKSISIGVRISEVQAELLDKLIKDGKAKNRSDLDPPSPDSFCILS